MIWRIKQYGERWRIETQSANSIYWWFHGSRLTLEDAEWYLAEELRKVSLRMSEIRRASIEARRHALTKPLKRWRVFR